MPFVFIHPSKLGWVFNTKAVVVPMVAIGTMIWVRDCVSRADPRLWSPPAPT